MCFLYLNVYWTQISPQIPLERALRLNIVDTDVGTIRDPATGRTLSIAEAVNEGIVLVECTETELAGQSPISPQSAGRSQTLPSRTNATGSSNARKRSHVSRFTFFSQNQI